jgi:hypothetical protein
MVDSCCQTKVDEEGMRECIGVITPVMIEYPNMTTGESTPNEPVSSNDTERLHHFHHLPVDSFHCDKHLLFFYNIAKNKVDSEPPASEPSSSGGAQSVTPPLNVGEEMSSFAFVAIIVWSLLGCAV